MNLWDVLKPPARAAFRAVSRLNLVRKYRCVFILGHVRSGSTLLAHILASHPDFVGAGEMHIPYRTPADLQELVLKTSEFLRKPLLHETYIVDQINHEYVTDEVLLSDAIYKCVILLRKPEGTLKSLMKLSKNPEKPALDHYIERLKTLAHYGSILKERAFLVEYDNLVDETDRTLAGLTSFLGLSSPLTPTYANHRMTARIFGHGDPSNNIKIGHVVRTPSPEIAVSEETLIAATRAFRMCRDQLQTTTAKASSSSS